MSIKLSTCLEYPIFIFLALWKYELWGYIFGFIISYNSLAMSTLATITTQQNWIFRAEQTVLRT